MSAHLDKKDKFEVSGKNKGENRGHIPENRSQKQLRRIQSPKTFPLYINGLAQQELKHN